jgi:hypothetical protein
VEETILTGAETEVMVVVETTEVAGELEVAGVATPASTTPVAEAVEAWAEATSAEEAAEDREGTVATVVASIVPSRFCTTASQKVGSEVAGTADLASTDMTPEDSTLRPQKASER